MPYKLVSEHEEGQTFREIAEANDIDFSRGAGLYQLVKKEKVSANKQLVLFKNGKLLSDDSVEVRRLCGLAVGGDVNVEPKHVPAGHQLFVQSTSPNRKIPEDAAVLIVVDNLDEEEDDGANENGDDDGEDGHVDKKQATGTKMAVKFEYLFDAFGGEYDGDSHALFNVKIGTMHSDCDNRVAEKAQKESMYQLSQLFRVDWDESAFHFEIEDDDCYGIPNFYAIASAKGTLRRFVGEEDAEEKIPVRVEYKNDTESGEYRFFAVSLGSKWGLISGSAGDHPFAYSNEIVYDNSDGSTSEDLPAPLPEGDSVTNTQRINVVINHGIKWFQLNCSNTMH